MGQTTAETVKEIEATRSRAGSEFRELEARLPAPALWPRVPVLCKEGIIAVHSGGAKGLAIDEALRSFGRRGISRLQSDLFIESMTRAGLVAGGSEGRLHATVRGLAYAGINPRGAVAGSRVAAP